MKQYHHPNGYKTEQYTRLNGDKVYRVFSKSYIKIIEMLYEHELLDFGFVEDKQEDWIDSYIIEFSERFKHLSQSGQLMWKSTEQLNELMKQEMKTILIKHLPK